MNNKLRPLILFFAIILAACAPSKEMGIELDGTRWKLTELEGQGLIPGSGITLMFEAGKFFGSAGCNNYGGKYTTTSDLGFALNEIEKNVMLCLEPPGIMEQEDQFIAAFTSARSYKVLNSELQLINEGGPAVLKFELRPNFVEVSPEELVGVTWRLASAPGLDGMDLGNFTLNFDGQSFSGTTTCRDYAGTYTATNDRLKIGYLEMTTDVACEEDMLIAEGWYTTLLGNIEQYNVLDAQLELYTLKGEKIVFELSEEQE